MHILPVLVQDLAPGCGQKPGLGAFLVGGETLAHYQTALLLNKSYRGMHTRYN